MAQALIDDLDAFKAFLATQPLCRWAAQKQRDIAAGLHDPGQAKGMHGGAARASGGASNADLAAALSSMA